MKYVRIIIFILISQIFFACPIEDSVDFDTLIYLTNQSNDTLTYRMTIDVAHDYNDSIINDFMINAVFDRINIPQILAPYDSIIIEELSSENLINPGRQTYFTKFLVYNLDTIIYYNLTKEEVQRTHRGVTSYVYRNTYTDFSAINFTLKYPH